MPKTRDWNQAVEICDVCTRKVHGFTLSRKRGNVTTYYCVQCCPECKGIESKVFDPRLDFAKPGSQRWSLSGVGRGD